MSESSLLTLSKQVFLGSGKGRVLFLLLISGSIFLSNLDGWELWNPDEPRYAQVAREMRDTGEWILPHLNSEVYPDKPPVFFWLIALFSYFTGGVNEVSARLPSGIAAVGCILLTYFMGKRLFDARTGLLASIILMTNSEFFWLGRRANIDMTLTLLVMLAITFFYLGLQEEKRSQWFYLVPYLFLGLGVLTKGPVGFLLPLISIITYLGATKNLKRLKGIHLSWGMLIFIGVVLTWVVPACIKGGEAYTREILLQQNVGRFADAWNHQQPFYYYLYTFPAGFVPWILLLPGALVWGLSKSQRAQRASFYFPFCWLLAIFIFFTLSTSKRELYILPLYPAAAIMIGGFLSYLIQSKQVNLPFKYLTLPFYFLGGTFLAGGLGSFVFPLIKTPLSGILQFFPYFFLLTLVFIFGGCLIIFTMWKRQLLASFIAVAIIMVASSYEAIGVVLPKINCFKSAKPLSESIIRHLPEGKKLIAYGVKLAPFNFYTGLNNIKEISTFEALVPHFDSSETGLVLLMERDIKRLQEQSLFPENFQIVDRASIGHRTFVVLSRKGA